MSGHEQEGEGLTGAMRRLEQLRLSLGAARVSATFATAHGEAEVVADHRGARINITVGEGAA